MPRLFPVLALTAACLAPQHAQAQRTPPTLALSRPAWTAAEPFAHITAVRELASGAVLLADVVERRVHFIDASGRTMRDIGRIGAGPREFRVPAALVALRGDSTLLLDRDQRRFLIVTPEGALLDARRLPDALEQGAEFVRGADASGRLIFQASFLPANETNPFVAPSGRLAIVRTNPYRLEWIEPNGRVVRGSPVTVAPVPVVAADHRAFESPGMRIKLTFPAVKPPFQDTPVIDADDNVWVRRETAAGATTQPWDVFGADGAHRGVVTVPLHKHIVAITRRFVYVSRTDSDELRWLEAYAR